MKDSITCTGVEPLVLTLGVIEIEMESVCYPAPLETLLNLASCKVISCKVKDGESLDLSVLYCYGSSQGRITEEREIQRRSFALPEEWSDLCGDDLDAALEDLSKIKYSEWEAFVPGGTRFCDAVKSLATYKLISDESVMALSKIFFPSFDTVLGFAFKLSFALKSIGLPTIYGNTIQLLRVHNENCKQKEILGYIYIISSKTALKVGYSGDPESRLRTLQTAHPEKLKLVASIRATPAKEKGFHRKNKQKALSGEWYPVEMLDSIKSQLGIGNI